MAFEFKIMDGSSEILDWCHEQFGDSHKLENLWFAFKPARSVPDTYRLFVFYNEEDAMAFKLRWL